MYVRTIDQGGLSEHRGRQLVLLLFFFVVSLKALSYVLALELDTLRDAEAGTGIFKHG